MNRARGFSTIGMAMLLLLFGSLMLHGLRQQLSVQFAVAGSESLAIKAFARASVALEWATRQRWQLAEHWQCRDIAAGQGRGCVIQVADNRVVVAGQSGKEADALTLWRSAIANGDELHITPQGWSDFCPFRETERCILP